jgi:hypothetical protein
MIAGGLLQLAAPIYAAGTAAGSDISNTATASYEDPNTPGVPLNTVSNTVKIKVEKIAGIFVTDEGATDITNAGQYKPGDTVRFDFKITNKGNSAVQFSIPGQAIVSTAGDFQQVEYFNPAADNGAGAWVIVTNGIAAIPAEVVPVDGFIKARVVVKVRPTAAPGDALTVEFGKTAQTPTPGKPVSNVSRSTSPETSDSGDVYTVDITNGAPDISGLVTPPGVAINGIRESAAFQSVTVQAVNKAFVDINMTGTSPVPDPTAPGDVIKNKITYDINVKVDPNAPTTGPDANKNPSDLGATSVNFGGTTENHVLISDPVPANTTPTKLTAPTGWTPVYSTTPVPTGGITPDQVVWTKLPVGGTLPTTSVTFVGFIKDDDKVLPKSSTPYTGFQVVVQTTGASTTTPTTFSNVVDVLGSTPKADGSADPANPVKDQTGTAAPDTPTGGIPITTTITPLVGNLSVFNGPLTKPEASGPDGSKNTDFTNKSAEIQTKDAKRDPNTGVLQSVTPSTVSFSNTVENKGTVATNIYLIPTTPADKTTLAEGTLVKISYLTEDRTYTYNQSAGTFTPIPGDVGKAPLVIANVAKDGTQVYGVAVTLPTGVAQLQGYTVPVTAFADVTAPTAAATTKVDGTVKLPDSVTGANTATITGAQNTTLDTVYTGYIELKKDARILDNASDAGLSEASKPFNNGTLTAKPKPGQYIQYRIQYKNTSTDNGTSGSGNVLLNAGKLNIIEDGNATPNTWGAVTTHSPNSALDTSGGKVIYNDNALTNNDPLVTKYVVDMNAANVIIAPQGSGNFSFLRQVK